VRIALVEDGSSKSLADGANQAPPPTWKHLQGRVTNVEASIQAPIDSPGAQRVLHISDLMPTYFGRKGEDVQESVGRKMRGATPADPTVACGGATRSSCR